MLIAAARLFDGRADSIVEDPLIEVAAGRIVNVTQRDISTGSSDVIDLGDNARRRCSRGRAGIRPFRVTATTVKQIVDGRSLAVARHAR